MTISALAILLYAVLVTIAAVFLALDRHEFKLRADSDSATVRELSRELQLLVKERSAWQLHSCQARETLEHLLMSWRAAETAVSEARRAAGEP